MADITYIWPDRDRIVGRPPNWYLCSELSFPLYFLYTWYNKLRYRNTYLYLADKFWWPFMFFVCEILGWWVGYSQRERGLFCAFMKPHIPWLVFFLCHIVPYHKCLSNYSKYFYCINKILQFTVIIYIREWSYKYSYYSDYSYSSL